MPGHPYTCGDYYISRVDVLHLRSRSRGGAHYVSKPALFEVVATLTGSISYMIDQLAARFPEGRHDLARYLSPWVETSVVVFERKYPEPAEPEYYIYSINGTTFLETCFRKASPLEALALIQD